MSISKIPLLLYSLIQLRTIESRQPYWFKNTEINRIMTEHSKLIKLTKIRFKERRKTKQLPSLLSFDELTQPIRIDCFVFAIASYDGFFITEKIQRKKHEKLNV